MKFLVFVLVCLPLAMAEREERFLFDKDTLASLFNTPALLADLQNLIDIVGSDSSKALCQNGCVTAMHKPGTPDLLQHFCPVICNSLQYLMTKLHLTHDSNPVQTLKKRFVLDSLGVDTHQLKNVLQQLVDLLGSDAAEQVIENECHTLAKHNLVDSACSLIGHGYQSLIHLFHVHPDPNTPGASTTATPTATV